MASPPRTRSRKVARASASPQHLHVEADGGQRVAHLVGDLRGDAAHRRQLLGADQRLCLGLELGLARLERAGHGVELPRQLRHLVLALHAQLRAVVAAPMRDTPSMSVRTGRRVRADSAVAQKPHGDGRHRQADEQHPPSPIAALGLLHHRTGPGVERRPQGPELARERVLGAGQRALRVRRRGVGPGAGRGALHQGEVAGDVLDPGLHRVEEGPLGGRGGGPERGERRLERAEPGVEQRRVGERGQPGQRGAGLRVGLGADLRRLLRLVALERLERRGVLGERQVALAHQADLLLVPVAAR